MTPGVTENSFATSYFNRTGHRDKYELGWEIKSPDGDITSELIDSIKTDLNNIEKLIYDDETLLSGKYREAFDIESAIDWLLVELTANNDEMARSKKFFYIRKRNGLLKVGPPWDFDFGTFDANTIFDFGYHVNSALYYRKLRNDDYFCNRAKEKWTRYKRLWEQNIPLMINNKYNEIKRSALRNEMLWKEWLNPSGSYEEHVSNLKTYFFSDIDQMDKEINSFGPNIDIE